MMNKFKIGEKVAFLSEKGHGIVLEIVSNSKVKIEDEHGFEQIYELNQLVKIQGADYENSPTVFKDDEVKNSREQKSDFTIIQEKSSSQNANYWELDLHIENLIEDFKGMSNFEIMKKQMQEFKRFYSKAKANNIPKIVVIHGVGEGILKNEIRSFLDQQEFIEYYDASYLEYGKGATEVKFFVVK